MIKALSVAGLLLVVAVGDAHAQARAEISAPGVSAQALKGQIINEMFNRGFSILNDTPNLVVFDKVNNNFAATLFFGTPYGGAPHYRVTVSLAEIGGSTRAFSDIALIGNAGTAFERRTDFNQGNDLSEMQGILNVAAMRSGPVAPAQALPVLTTPTLTATTPEAADVP